MQATPSAPPCPGRQSATARVPDLETPHSDRAAVSQSPAPGPAEPLGLSARSDLRIEGERPRAGKPTAQRDLPLDAAISCRHALAHPRSKPALDGVPHAAPRGVLQFDAAVRDVDARDP